MGSQMNAIKWNWQEFMQTCTVSTKWYSTACWSLKTCTHTRTPGMHHRNTLNISRIHPRNLGLNQDLHESHLGNIWYSYRIHMGSIWDPHGKYMGPTWETFVMYLRKTWVPYWIPDKSHMGPILNPFSFPMWIPHVAYIFPPTRIPCGTTVHMLSG